MKAKSKSVYVFIALAIGSFGFHLYKLEQREVFYEDREIYQVQKWCDGSNCSQEIQYIVGDRFEFESEVTKSTHITYPTRSFLVYDQPNFLRGDIITIACKEAIPFTFFGIGSYGARKPPDCEFHSLKKKYGKRYEEKD